MRKLMLALFTMFFMAGLVIAVEVTVVSYDKETKELKVKEGDAEKTYKITDKTKFSTTDIKGENAKEADYAAFEKRFGGKGGKGGKGRGKVDIKTDKDTVTEATWKAFGGKKKDKK